MSVGPILTLGLGAFTDGGVRFLPTLGYGTQGTPPTPAVTVGGGAGRPVYVRRKWREIRHVIDDGLVEVYAELVEARLPRDVMGEAVKAVKPYADKSARFKSVPKSSEVDWKAMARDLDGARKLIEIHQKHVAAEARRAMDEDDELAIYLLH